MRFWSSTCALPISQESAIRTAKRILALDPLREDMHRWLMRAFAAAGQRASALAAYDACRSLLQEELGVPPEPETDALYKAILLRVQPAAVAVPMNGRLAQGAGAPPERSEEHTAELQATTRNS